jgi:hypothetical protein
MSAFSNWLENLLADGLYRGGCLTTAGAAGSSAVVKGIWAASTAYSVGDIVVPHANMTGAGGKLLRCTTAGTSGTTNTLAVPNPGTTLTDNTVTWTAIATMPALYVVYRALLTCTKGVVARSTAYALNDTAVVLASDSKYHLYKVTTAGTTAGSAPTYAGAGGEAITDGTAVLTEQSAALDANTATVEPSGGNYSRASINCTLANFSGTQSAGSTTASTGTNATISNNNTITFPTPNAAWANGSAMIWGYADYDSPTSGNLIHWGPLTAPVTVNATDPAPTFAAAAQTLQIDN